MATIVLYNIFSPFFNNRSKNIPKHFNHKVCDIIERQPRDEIILREVEVADTSGTSVAFTRELMIF